METIEKLQEISATVVRNLRKQKLGMGLPFMINSRDLPAKHSYLEYPDTSIRIVSIGSDSRSFTEIRKLSNQEAAAIRKLHNLL